MFLKAPSIAEYMNNINEFPLIQKGFKKSLEIYLNWQ